LNISKDFGADDYFRNEAKMEGCAGQGCLLWIALMIGIVVFTTLAIVINESRS